MTDEVVENDAVESQEADDAPATPPVDDSATWKARLAGKDRALSNAQKELDRLKAEAAALSKWKAEREEAELTEVERYQRRIAELEATATEAQRKAARAELSGRYPRTFELLGDRAPVDDEEFLAATEARLTPPSDEPDEPLIDPNKPRRPAPTAKSPKDKTSDELKQELRGFGNPFADGPWAGNV